MELKAKTVYGEEIIFNIEDLLSEGEKLDGIFTIEGDFGYMPCLVDSIEIVQDKSSKEVFDEESI